MTFSEKLITLRAGRGWSQERLAKELGVTRQAVGRWERGECLPDAVGLTGLARVFDIDSEWLLDENAAGTPEPRAARRVKLAWFDWLMLSLAAASLIAMLCGINLDEADRRFSYEYRYPAWTWGAIVAQPALWFAGCWSAVALIYSFFARPMPLKCPLKLVFIIVGFAVTAVFLFSVFVTWGQALGSVDLDISVWTYLRITEHPELCTIPGILFSICVKRKEKRNEN